MISKYCFVFFCVLFVTLDSVCGQKQFRNDYSYFGEVDGWYKMHIIPANWTDARLRCHLEGAVLASPLDRQQDQAMNIMITRYGLKKPIFTGIHSTFSKGDFFSVEGVSLKDIPQKWAENEPNNLNDAESCIQQSPTGSLADVSCDITLPYMCFKKSTKGMVVSACGTVDPEYKYEARTGKCYKFHVTAKTWSRAFMTCAAEGAHLVIVNSKLEATVLKEIVARYPKNKIVGPVVKHNVWAGFHDWDSHAEWRTINGDTLKQAGYLNFYPGDPNNGEYCGNIDRELRMNDLGCSFTMVFMCEKKPKGTMDEK